MTDPSAGLFPARVAGHSRGIYRLLSASGDLTASVAGRLAHEAAQSAALPVVGDWILGRLASPGQAVIENVLERRTKLSRIAPGERTEEQILATNVDVVFLVTSLTREFKPRRIERYLVQIWESGARPVIVLNKEDLVESPDEFLRQAEETPLIDVLLTSATTGSGIERLRGRLGAGETAVFVGSSGVGKSSIINRLLGDTVQAVRAVRAGDDRGRHTTAAREMFLLPAGGVIIDTPGLRELQVLADPSTLGQTFPDVDKLAANCAFRDCMHVSEPGCAVKAAVEDGTLDGARLRGYRKLQRELDYAKRRTDRSSQLAEKRKWKQIQKQYRRRCRERER
ncbi:MAG: ribosome small subunit-dependent GTPase A [Dehalococcoidia bacterium]|nr:MAG: ribosome small subunit-dependent GTPase A [Dehalococcoidia bacterium]